MKKISMSDVKHAQFVAAKLRDRAWWFGPGEMKFFNSLVETKAIPAADGRIYFVTSERFEDDWPKKYTIRFWHPDRPWEIETVGPFQRYDSLQEAVEEACRLSQSPFPRGRSWAYWLNKRVSTR